MRVLPALSEETKNGDDEQQRENDNAVQSNPELNEDRFQSMVSRIFKRTPSQPTHLKSAQSTSQNDNGFASSFFRKSKSVSSLSPEKSSGNTQPTVYSEYINKLSSFISGDGTNDDSEKMNGDSPMKSKSFSSLFQFNGNPNVADHRPSDVMLHPQRNMFSDYDWMCLEHKDEAMTEEKEDENERHFHFDSAEVRL